MTPRTIAITGGIGCGKSVVSRILRLRGYKVVDTDSHARAIMDTDEEIKRRLAEEIAAETVVDGVIDRRRLARIVFADRRKLERLNAIVHSKVRESLMRMAADSRGPLFIETAILFQSGLNRMVDAEWRVVCPPELRISRVMARNGISRDEVLARMGSQDFTPAPSEPQPPLTLIHNDETRSMLVQISDALAAAGL